MKDKDALVNLSSRYFRWRESLNHFRTKITYKFKLFLNKVLNKFSTEQRAFEIEVKNS